MSIWPFNEPLTRFPNTKGRVEHIDPLLRELMDGIQDAQAARLAQFGGKGSDRDLAAELAVLRAMRVARKTIGQKTSKWASSGWINRLLDQAPGWNINEPDLGSGLIDYSQKMTVAAMQMADMKV